MTSDDTSRDANISVEIYVDDVLVGRVDNIVRDENVRPISVSVNGGKVLMIKAINTDSASGSICYVSDTNLTVLQQETMRNMQGKGIQKKAFKTIVSNVL